MGRGRGKSVTMGALQKKMGVQKSGSAKESRKAAASGAKKAREGKMVDGGKGLLIHPRSRKAKQLMRNFSNEAKKAGMKSIKERKERARLMKFIWFKDAIEAESEKYEGMKCLQPNYIQEIAKIFITRHDAELKALREKRTITASYRLMPPTGREKELLAYREEEIKQARSGDLEIPHIGSRAGLTALLAWDRELTTLYTVPGTEIRVEKEVESAEFSLGSITSDKIQLLKKRVLQKHDDRRKGRVLGKDAKEARQDLQTATSKSRRAELFRARRNADTDTTITPTLPAAVAKAPAKKKISKVEQAQMRAAETAGATPFDFKPAA
eukprot:TRINITY_DN24709_c0_g1_i1.p1 TRINITY_DN24709_c0_g1~~TRINITY_DN24709_c0_g1_i1.p1  ORF type:complete len:343 (+),score=80.83 TRINITY_DN24709_c0_g1_i1:57-1031(+)